MKPSAIETAAGIIRQRDAEIAALRAAIEAVLPFIDDALDVQEFFADSAAGNKCRAAVDDIYAALGRPRAVA